MVVDDTRTEFERFAGRTADIVAAVHLSIGGIACEYLAGSIAVRVVEV